MSNSRILSNLFYYGIQLFLGEFSIMYTEGQHIAANPETDPKTLESLSKSGINYIMEAVAENPNTPIPVLWKLVKFFPHQVVNNPTFNLITLEDSNWITGILAEDLLEIIQQPNTPNIFRKEAVKHDNYLVRKTAIEAEAKNPQTPAKWLEEITLYHGTLHEQVIEHPNITLDSLKKFATCKKTSIQIETARYCLCDRDKTLNTLSLCQNDVSDIIECVIQNILEHDKNDSMLILLRRPKIHRKYIKMFLENLPYQLQLALARDKTTSPEVLDELMSNSSCSDPLQFQICQALAYNPGTSVNTLDKLIDGKHKTILLDLAKRTVFSQDLLVKLIINPYKKIIKKLLKNNSIQADLLAELQEHPNQMVREFVAQHPNTPITYENLRLQFINLINEHYDHNSPKSH
jgi:hypothetical protein